MALQHLRSSTASKRPLPAGMSDGQLAINTNTASPGLFFKDSAGALIKVGPVHVGTTAPNASPASGGQTGNTVGEQWLDTTGGGYVFKVWDGSAWRSETGEFVNVNGDTMTGDLVMNNANIVFEGATADDFETTLTVTDPTADRTITLPDVSGNVVTTGDTGTVTSTMIADGTIVNADVNANAAIAHSKLASITAGQVLLGNASNVPTATALSGDITVDSSGVTAISSGVIVDADINASAEIAVSKLADGAARQLLQTDAAGTGVEWTDNVDIPGTLDVTGAATFDSSATIVGDLTVDTNTLYVDSTNNRVAIGTTSPSGIVNLDRPDLSTDTWLRVSQAGTEVFSLSQPSSSEIRFATPDLSVDREFTFYTKGLERVRIDSSGRLLVGTSSTSTCTAAFVGRSDSSTESPFIRLDRNLATPADGNALGTLAFGTTSDSSFKAGAKIDAFRDGGTWTANVSMPSRLVFSTAANGASSPTERMRIKSNGQLSTFDSGGYGHVIESSRSASTSDYFIFGRYSATNIVGSGGTQSFGVYTNGNVVNTNNSYGSLSDAKLKENIVDASSQWNDLKAIQVRNYNFKEGQTHTQIGVVAQEIELVSPGLVSESPDRDEDGNDLGTVTKSVNYSVLYMKAVKALQEAMERIETLEAKVAALETK